MEEIHRIIKNLLGNKEKPVIIEIGMREGEDTEKILSLLKDPIYIGFEPEPHSISKIKEKGLDQQILFYPCAISNINTESIFYISNTDDGWTGSSSLKKPTGHLEVFPHVRFEKTIKVPVVPLDLIYLDLIQQKIIDKIISFIWIDCQGGEKEFIEGATETLKNTRYLYSEYYNSSMYEDQLPLLEWMKLLPSQWKIIKKWGNDILLKNKNVE